MSGVLSLWREEGVELSNSVGVDPLEVLNFGDGEHSDPSSPMFTGPYPNSRTYTEITPSMGSGSDVSAAVICTSACTWKQAVSYIPVELSGPLILTTSGGYCLVGYLSLTITTNKASYMH